MLIEKKRRRRRRRREGKEIKSEEIKIKTSEDETQNEEESDWHTGRTSSILFLLAAVRLVDDKYLLFSLVRGDFSEKMIWSSVRVSNEPKWTKAQFAWRLGLFFSLSLSVSLQRSSTYPFSLSCRLFHLSCNTQDYSTTTTLSSQRLNLFCLFSSLASSPSPSSSSSFCWALSSSSSSSSTSTSPSSPSSSLLFLFDARACASRLALASSPDNWSFVFWHSLGSSLWMHALNRMQ